LKPLDNFGGYDFGITDFATQFGGPLEIIQDKFNGFYINPTLLEETAEKFWILSLSVSKNLTIGMKFPRGPLTGFTARTPGKIHTTRLLSLARIYGFWNFGSKKTGRICCVTLRRCFI